VSAPPSARPERWALAGVLTLLPLLLSWPLPARFTSHVMAAPDQEAAPHIWGLWAAGQTAQPLRIETFLQAFPDGVGLVLVDPLNLPAYHLGALLGPAAGYNLVLITGIVLMGIAGALLARELGGRPWLGATAAMACPTLLANAADGMTEGFGVGMVGVFLALLLRARRSESRWTTVLAGLALGATTWAGPYNAIWAGLLGLGVAAWTTWRRRWDHLRTTAMVGAIGVLVGLPVGVAIFRSRDEGLPGGSDRAGLPEIIENPHIFRGGVRTGADLLDPLLPIQLTGSEADVSHTAYLGLVLVAAACVAAVRHPRARPFLAAAAAFALLSLGPWLYLGGSVLRLGDAPLAGPAGLAILAVPVLGRLTRWYRAGAVATLLLAPLAARLPRSTPVAIGLGLAILIDTLALAPLAWPLHASALPPTRPIAQLPHPGALLELPPVTSGEPPPGAWRDLSALAQVQHGRPIGGSMMGLGVSPAAREGTDAIRALTRTGQLDGVLHERIRSDGFRYLVIHLAHHPVPRAGGEHLTACLGPPVVHTATLRVHDLGVPGTPAGCSTDVMTVPSAGSGL